MKANQPTAVRVDNAGLRGTERTRGIMLSEALASLADATVCRVFGLPRLLLTVRNKQLVQQMRG